ncbi:hypothetical protein ACOSP7_010309 [Xanthoceras sorbifolium]
MGFLNISAKFDGIQTDFLVDKLEEYTLSSLIADVYLFTLSKLPELYEKFKVEVKLPWSGEYKVIDNNNQLQNIFTEFIQRKIRCIRVDVELLPISTLPSVEFSDDYFPCQEDHATPDAPFVCISSDSGGDSSEEDQTSNIRSTTPACDTDSEYSAQSDYNTDSYDFSAHTQDQVASDSENDHNNSKAAAKKRKSEVGTTSASNARRKLNIGQSPHGQTSIVIAASTSGIGHHPEQSSQPLSQNAPLLSGSQAAYDTHNTSNPSTVAGLNSDWSPTF